MVFRRIENQPQKHLAAQVNTVVQASVASVKPYGIFVRLKGFRANGLVHLSQVGAITVHSVLGSCQMTLLGLCCSCIQHHLGSLLVLLQISDHLEIGKDESDEDKINALSAVHSVGDPLWVKVSALTHFTLLECLKATLSVSYAIAQL